MIVFFSRLWIQLTADRRKFGALCGMVALGLLLWARIIVVSNVPRTAIADPDEADTGAEGESPTTDNPDDAGTPDRIYVSVSTSTDRDPFRIDGRYFPRTTQLAQLNQDLGKSTSEDAEDQERAEAELISGLQSHLDKTLRLEAVMTGGPMAVINGKTYWQDDPVVIPENPDLVFRLTLIRQRSVALEWEGRHFELKMRSPGT